MTNQAEGRIRNVMLIDDEPMSVKRLTGLLNKTGMVKVVGGFTDPEEALLSRVARTVDIAFVDIEMPTMTGLLLAEKLQEQNPGLEVVMVTAHDQYALEAFQAHAVGYLLKPVALEALTRELDKLNQKRMVRQPLSETIVLTIHTFGQFQCFTDNGQPDYFSWRTAKAKELLAFLYYHQGNPVTRDVILEYIWPEMELDRAVKNFHATNYYLRETLKKRNLDHLLERKNGAYRLKWEEVMSDESTYIEAVTKMNNGKCSVETLETILKLHNNTYFGIDDYRWADDRRNHYESMYLQALDTLSEKLDEIDDDKRRFHILMEMVKQDPYNEEIHERIIDVHLKTNHIEAAHQHFNHMKNIFIEELGIEPPGHLYGKIKNA